MFDAARPPAPPRDAASVVLVRPRGGAGGPLEVFLLRRHRKASFMSSAFVFPGGAADPDDGDPRATAARELFEEAGVLLAADLTGDAPLAAWRAELAAGARLAEVLGRARLTLALDQLHYLAHWITPSAEPKRFSARFYVAELPAGQTPSFDNQETVDECWVTPDEALARAGELRLPPPQVRTFADLRAAAAGGVAALRALCAERAAAPHPIMPRLAQLGAGFALLLPWDPDYQRAGQGEALALPPGHPLATGPSRFVLEGTTWTNVFAAPSPPAG